MSTHAGNLNLQASSFFILLLSNHVLPVSVAVRAGSPLPWRHGRK